MDATRIFVTACSLFALMSGVDVVLARGKPVPPPTPTYPPARFWHAFTSNDAASVDQVRLYMFGGSGSYGSTVKLNDLWAYTGAGSTSAKWTPIPASGSWPTPRMHVGWSCDSLNCVAANGSTGTSFLKETWIFSQASKTWSQVNCKRFTCPSARFAPTVAYDRTLKQHVLFGGDGNSGILDDTFAFDATTKTWTSMGSKTGPSARYAAAAVFVPAIGRVVMFGGSSNSTRLNDMYSWNGATWEAIEYTNPSSAPYLNLHDMAWAEDPAPGHLIVTGGLVGKDIVEATNIDTWHVTFETSGGAWKATWTLKSRACVEATSAGSSSSDSTVHRYARMAYDPFADVQVYFGGLEDPTVFGNTVECR